MASIIAASIAPTAAWASGTQRSIAGGESFSVAVASDGTVLSWGDNRYGQLGDGSNSPHASPQRVPGLSGAIAVAAGARHALVLKSDGTVWAFGSNGSAQLGDGTTTSRSLPVQVANLSNVVAVATGSYHSFAVRSDGTLWAWGSNGSGRLGDGTTIQRSRPVQITALSGIVAIAGGSVHSLAVRSDGTVWSWGSNANGQLGDGTVTSHSLPAQIGSLGGISGVAAGDSHSVAITQSGTLFAWGNNGSGRVGDGTAVQRTTPVAVPGPSSVTQVDAGVSHTIALTANGAVYCWGDNLNGQLGDGTTTQHTTPTAVAGIGGAITIAAGFNHSIAAGSNGAIYAWGSNDWGQIGDGIAGHHLSAGTVLNLSAITRIATGDAFALALRSNGTVAAWGDNSFGQLGDGTLQLRVAPITVSSLTGITALAAGSNHALALKSDGSVWAWGSNGSGQIGDGTTTKRTSPVRVNNLTGVAAIAAGDYHSLALKNDGTLWAWGANGSGRLGDGTTTQRNTPVQVSGLTNVAGMAGGNAYTLARKTDGTVWAWGNNANGQLGEGTITSRTTPVQVLSLAGIAAVSAGDSHSFALASSGALYAWGNNGSGRLGDGSTSQRLSPVLAGAGVANSVLVRGGVEHSLALNSNGQLYAWGDNLNGQLGDGSSTQRNSPVAVPSLSDIVAADAGAYFSLALRSNGTVLAWGSNDSGQLGDGTLGVEVTPVQVTSPSATLAVDTLRTVAAGAFHTVALGSNGMVWAWGLNSSGQLGDTTTILRNLPSQVVGLRNVKAVAAGEYHSIALTTDGRVMAWGQNGTGQLGSGDYNDRAAYGPVLTADGSRLSGVVAIAAGSYHNLALTADGKVYAWGSNSNGQLGINSSALDQTRAVQIQNLSGIVGISAGAYHSLARSNGTLFGWGANFYGALGAGVNVQTPTPVSILPELGAVVRIAAGAYHSMAIKSDGAAVAWGWNGYGQLGDGSTSNRSSSAPILNLPNSKALAGSLFIAGHCAAATSAGTLETWGGNAFGQLGNGSATDASIPSVINYLPQITSFATGGYHTVAAAVDGSIYVWGYNGFGQLGDGTNADQTAPVRKAGFSLLPTSGDTDGDNLPDWWEIQYFGNLVQTGDGDPEVDGLVNLLEFQQALNPTVVDYVPPSPGEVSSQLINGSGQAPAGTGENTIIAGFIVRGDAPKKVMIRALGPSLTLPPGSTPLADPKIDLFDSSGHVIARNDNWRVTQLGGLISADQVSQIQATGLAPTRDQEAALIVIVPPGGYTAQIHSADNSTGIALLEMYDLDLNSSQIVNVSARARLGTGDNVLIGGFTIIGSTSLNIIARALGPSLASYGIQGALQDPTLELYDNAGVSIAFNDNWRDTQQAEVIATGIPPADNREAAIIRTLPPAHYTAVVRGRNATSGVALIEVYDLQTPAPPPSPGVTASFNWSFVGQSWTSGGLRMNVDGTSSYSVWGPITQYEWSWGDGSPLGVWSTPTAVHTYASRWSGQSLVLRLRISDRTGRSASLQRLVRIVPEDSDGNGLPDWWETQYFGHIGVDPNGDPDGDGLTNLQEYQGGTDPTDYYNGANALMSVFAGDGQAAYPNTFTGSPLVVRVTGASGQPLVNAPVTFGSSIGSLALTNDEDASLSPYLIARTDTNGQAAAYFYTPNLANYVSPVVATAGPPIHPVSATFSESTTSFPSPTPTPTATPTPAYTPPPSPTPPGPPDPPPPPPPPPSPPPTPTPYSTPALVGEQASFSGYKYGVPGFQEAVHRYLHSVANTTSTDPDGDGDGGSTTTDTTIDPRTGQAATSTQGHGGTDYGGAWNVTSDTSKNRSGTDDDGSGETSTASVTLANLYSTDQFKANVQSWLPSFRDTFLPNVSTASLSLSADELNYSLTKLQYKFMWSGQPANRYLLWNVKFSPADGSDPGYTSKQWSGSANQSEVQTINPVQLNPDRSGNYSVELPNSYDIQIDSFIPHNWVFDPTNIGEPSVFNGNERSTGAPPSGSVFQFSQNEHDWKTMERATVFPLAAGANSSIENGSFYADTGYTRAYAFALAVQGWMPNEIGYPIDGTGTIRDDSINESRRGHNGFLGEGKAETSGMHVSVTHPADKIVSAHFTNATGIPLIYIPGRLGKVQCDITVVIDGSQSGPPIVRVTGRHTLFPSFELFVNGRQIYTYDAIATGDRLPADLLRGLAYTINLAPVPLQ